MFSNEQLNKILIKYDDLIKFNVHKFNFIDFSKPYSIDLEDIYQEVRIKLITELSNKFDEKKGNLEAFVVGWLPNIVRSVLIHTSRSLNQTGSPASTRSQTKTILDSTNYFCDNDLIDSCESDLSIDMDKIVTYAEKELEEKYYQVFISIFVEGNNQAETARKLNKHRSTVCRQVNEIINPFLKRTLKKFGYLNEK